MSYYQTLGVEQTATQDEIKKAYRKLSKEHHPDVNGGDDTRFKEIAAAYDILGNEQKRQQYDAQQGGHDFFSQFARGAGQNHSMSDIFDQFFGGQFRQQQAQKGPDYRVDMHISFEEAFNGTRKEFSLNGQNLSVEFKPGLKTGQKFRLKGKGGPHPYNSNLPNGDVMVHVQVMTDGRFILQGNDIWIEHSIPWWDIITGTKINAWTPDGLISINIPKGTAPGKTLRIKGKGYPIYNTDTRGDLLCRVNPTYPELNEQQISLVEQIKEHG